MRKDRLLVLAEFLETSVPKERFCLEEWAVRGDEPEFDECTLEYKACGTVACASGWAATIPAFRKAGFKLSRKLEPTYKGNENWEAVSAFFGLELNVDESTDYYYPFENTPLHTIFCPQAYKKPPTPKQVAKRIRKIVGAA